MSAYIFYGGLVFLAILFLAFMELGSSFDRSAHRKRSFDVPKKKKDQAGFYSGFDRCRKRERQDAILRRRNESSGGWF